MTTIQIVGMDPSLSSWGFAWAQYHCDTRCVDIIELGIAKTAPATHKTVRKNSDDLYRAKALADKALEATRDAVLSFVEVPHGSQSARAMASYGIAIGVLASLRATGRPLIEISATEVKIAMTGKPNGSKQQVIEQAINSWPALNWPRMKRGGTEQIVHSRCEHLADAIGAISAGIKTDEFKQLISMYSRQAVL